MADPEIKFKLGPSSISFVDNVQVITRNFEITVNEKTIVSSIYTKITVNNHTIEQFGELFTITTNNNLEITIKLAKDTIDFRTVTDNDYRATGAAWARLQDNNITMLQNTNIKTVILKQLIQLFPDEFDPPEPTKGFWASLRDSLCCRTTPEEHHDEEMVAAAAPPTPINPDAPPPTALPQEIEMTGINSILPTLS